MAFPKYKPPSPPKDKIVKDKRLVNGKLTPVEIFNGKIVRVFDNEGNVVDDRSAKFGNKLPPLPEVKTKSKVGEIPRAEQEEISETEGVTQKEEETTTMAEQHETGNIVSIVHQPVESQHSQSKYDDIPKDTKELTEYDKIMKMPDQLFKQEIASMSDGGLEGYMKRLSLSSWEKADIRGRRANLYYVPKVDDKVEDKKPEDILKIEDKKSEDIPKAEIPKFLGNLSSTSSLISTSGTSGIPLISKEETVGQGSEPDVIKSEVITPKPEEINKAEIIAPKEEETATYVPKIEPVIPIIEIPKSEPSKEVKDVPIPRVNLPDMDRLSKIMEEKTKEEKKKEEKTREKNIIRDKERSSNITKSESPKGEAPKEVPKAEIRKEIPKETPKTEQGKIKKPKEVKHFMAEEDEEIMQERKFEQWLKKNKFQESVEKTAKISEENQEKIEGISNEITNIKEGLGGVDNRINTFKEDLNSVIGETKKPIVETLGELCEGVDCIKKDVAKYQDTQSELDKKLDSRFTELRERVQNLEEPTFTCDNCGADGIRPLSSFCPNCGSPIHSWNDDAGQPVRGWVPYWKRERQIV